MNTKNAPNGTTVTAQLHRIEQVEYCALIGRAFDPQLKTLVKNGAWYSADVDFHTVFGDDITSISGSGGRYNCNNQLGVDPNMNACVKYCPSNKTLSVSVYVSHRDTHDYGDY